MEKSEILAIAQSEQQRRTVARDDQSPRILAVDHRDRIRADELVRAHPYRFQQ